MKNRPKFAKINRYIIAFGMVSCLPMVGRADTLLYSTTGNITPVTDGVGTIGTASGTNFYDLTTSTATLPAGTGNILQFGDGGANSETGTAGTVTVSGTIQENGLSFLPTATGGNTNAYNLTGGTIALQTATPTISLAATSGNILSTLTTAAGSTLTLTGYSSSSSTGITLSNSADSLGGNLTLGTSSGAQNALLTMNYAVTATNLYTAGTTAITVNNGDTLRFNSGLVIPTAVTTTITGSGAGGRGSLSLYGGAVTASLQGAIILAGNNTINNRDMTTISGNITQSATSTLTISQDTYTTDSILFSGTNSFAGLSLTSFVNNASVKAGSSSAFGAGLLTIDSYSAGGGVPYSYATELIDLNAQTVNVNGLTGAANTAAGTTTAADDTRVIGNSATSGTGTLNLTNTSNYTYYGKIEDGTTTFAVASNLPVATAVAGGKTAVTQSGTGTTTLGGNNTYSGDTTITAGQIALTAGATLANSRIVDNATNGFNVSAFTSGFALSLGQELAGSGSVKGQINLVSGSMINPGSIATAGTLTLNNGLDVVAPGAMLNFRLNTTSTSDLLAIAGGALTESLGTIINLSNGGSFAGLGTYNLLDATAIGVGDITLGDYTLGTTIAGYTEMLVVNGNDNILQLQVTAAPEPGVLSMLAGGGLLLVLVATHRRFKFRV